MLFRGEFFPFVLLHFGRVHHIERFDKERRNRVGRLHDDNHQQDLRYREIEVGPTVEDEFAKRRHRQHYGAHKYCYNPQHGTENIEGLANTIEHNQTARRQGNHHHCVVNIRFRGADKTEGFRQGGAVYYIHRHDTYGHS